MISISDGIELLGTVATIIALIYAIKSFAKSTRIQEAVFIQNLFENFQRDRQAILGNPRTLKILAKERGVSAEQLLRASMGSFDINRAYLIYHLHQRGLTPENRWEQDVKDMVVQFSDALVMKRWQEIQDRYPQDFQQFIQAEIFDNSTT